MSERLRFIVSGFFVGVAELLPGVSGSTIALAFNVYDKFILFLSNLRVSNLTWDIKKLNKIFYLDLIVPFLFSMMLSVILASKLILFLYSSFTEYFLIFISALMCLVAIIIGARIRTEFDTNFKFDIYFFAGVVLALVLKEISISPGNISDGYIFLTGFIAFTFFLLPGISGSAILLSFGVYESIIGSIAILNFSILIPFAFGCLISLLTMPKLLNSLLEVRKKEIMTFFTALILLSGILTFPFENL
ncbi:DUF368 domain-containing protein [Gammaproteobacteria bacterium]|nr:DUF368 domain-containing protein [Gammaproteobacteria bacterium]